jgi:enoyl-CoA hydratase
VTDTLVAVTEVGPVTEIRIDRPETHNALNRQVLAELESAFAAVSADRSRRAVVVTGTGPRAFSAGADLHELEGLDLQQAHEVIRDGQRVMRAVECCPVPVLAAVNGWALGGGFELVLSCTLPVLATTASLGLPEAGLGLIPGYGGTQRLTRALGRVRAAQLMLTGERVDAARAYAWGLTAVEPVEPDGLLARAHDIAASIAARGPLACRSIIEAQRLGTDQGLELGLALETALAAAAIVGTESTEGVAAFREKRTPSFDGAAG